MVIPFFSIFWDCMVLGGGQRHWTDGWVICFSQLLMLISFWCLLLLLHLAQLYPWNCHTPSQHNHASMRPTTFTSHLSSPSPPTHIVSSRLVYVVHIRRRSPTVWYLVSVNAAVLSSFLPHHFHLLTFQSHPSSHLDTFMLPASLHLFPSPFYTSSLLLFTSHHLPIYLFSVYIPANRLFPSSSHHLSLFHPCLPALMLEAQHWILL